MICKDFFGFAKWMGAADRTPEDFSVLRGHFQLDAPQKVTLNILGLGFFKCYINGNCINHDTFLPLSSDYEGGCDPVGEVLSAHRIYVPQFDVTPFTRRGDNVIAIQFGGGWYTHPHRIFGLPKAIYRIAAHQNGKITYFESDETCRVGKSYVRAYHFLRFETHDYTASDAWKDPSFDDSTWDHATVCEPLETE